MGMSACYSGWTRMGRIRRKGVGCFLPMGMVGCLIEFGLWIAQGWKTQCNDVGARMETEERNMSQQVRKGAELELVVKKLAFGGQGLGRVDDFVVFLDRALPGQRVRARVIRKRRQYAEARCLAVLEQTEHYQPAFCEHFGACGGCSWQELPYHQQLHWKSVQVAECLQHLANSSGALVAPILPAPETIYYRNKMEYSFSDQLWLPTPPAPTTSGRDAPRLPAFGLGLHARGAYAKVINLESCFLQSPLSVGILKEVRRFAEASGLAPYTTRSHQGFWRFLVVREGKHTGQSLVHVLTAKHRDQDRVMADLGGHLLRSFPTITSFVHSVSHKKAQVAIADDTRTVMGPGSIEEQLGALRFHISAHSFFQTNTLGAERLYDTILNLAGLQGNETVWDLYCGTGSIALYLAHRVRRVLGFEVTPEAVVDARRNAELNRIDNCVFRLGDMNELSREPTAMMDEIGPPDVIITDPPRAGMHPRVVKAILELAPAKIIAVSCNPSTLARDLAMLLPVYQLTAVQPLDLFPHTPHIECVAALEKRCQS
ncbi:MAG TPA: 23S rRNA (uracil(1939)-C(5))-methyltransferase RlmD [Syntrophobacteraceae bacterium]|nr:23S rRNA (uracil(1939)-C(5))-methyltransferase RlmD [Syntrophobacteraceae bacterium]